MKRKLVLSALLGLASLHAHAAQWDLIGSDKEAIVFLDAQSVHVDGTVVKARVLINHYSTAHLGDTVYPHKSKELIYAIDCSNGELGYSQWTMHSADLGSGETVWADAARDVSYFKPDRRTPEGRLVQRVCASPAVAAHTR